MKISLSRGVDGLKKVGEILITPAALLPLAGLLIMAGDLTGRFLGFPGADILMRSGTVLLRQFPLLAAVALAYGLANAQNGAAALSAAAAYLAFHQSGSALYELLAGADVQPSFYTGVFGGLIVGMVTVLLHNGCRSWRLPTWLDYFSGVRLSALLAVSASVLLGSGFGALAFLIRNGLIEVASGLTQMGTIGAFSYGFLNRLLFPFGLDHILNQSIWFDSGQFTDLSGRLVTGELSRFFAGDPMAGRLMAGFYPMLIFSMPAIALCFALTARIPNRTRLYLLMAITALVSLVSGVGQPLEYFLLFVSPLVYLIYAVLSGVSFLLSYQLQIRHGFANAAGLTDYLTTWHLATHPERVWQVGILMALLSFAVVYFSVKIRKLSAPGRDRPEADDEMDADNEAAADANDETAAADAPDGGE
ncbi:MAG: PTS transporter subunit EIIC [Saccharofermentanales bacterium]|jgi:PTS system N-acetylglucosamine-specific IIC component|nr:PTS transporter subunit EIIC [Clostridiaceae bacterium]